MFYTEEFINKQTKYVVSPLLLVLASPLPHIITYSEVSNGLNTLISYDRIAYYVCKTMYELNWKHL